MLVPLTPVGRVHGRTPNESAFSPKTNCEELNHREFFNNGTAESREKMAKRHRQVAFNLNRIRLLTDRNKLQTDSPEVADAEPACQTFIQLSDVLGGRPVVVLLRTRR